MKRIESYKMQIRNYTKYTGAEQWLQARIILLEISVLTSEWFMLSGNLSTPLPNLASFNLKYGRVSVKYPGTYM